MLSRRRYLAIDQNQRLALRRVKILTASFESMASHQVALVTAGSAGLGAAIARVLAIEARMSVVINYSSNVERAEALVSELRRATEPKHTQESLERPATGQQKFIAIKADMASRSEIVRLVRESVAAMGRLDVVVSNAGWTRMTDFMNLDDGVLDDDWDRCLNINVKSHLFLFHAAREYLDQSEGAFVSTASVAGVKPSGSSLVRERIYPLL